MLLVGDVQKQKVFLRNELQEEPNDEVREVEVKSSHEETCLQDVSRERKKISRFKDLTLSEIMEFRSFTNQVYREGVFDSLLREKIAEWLRVPKCDQVKER